jgi:hypothetical protein
MGDDCMDAGGKPIQGAIADDCVGRYIAPAISAFATSMWLTQELEQCP